MTYLVDTHCHINFNAYDEDRDAVLQRSKAANVLQIIIPATDLTTSHETVELAKQHGMIFAAVGIHPNSTADFRDEDLAQIAQMAGEPGVVAIGEIGLDYYWDNSPKEKQVHALEVQLNLAAKLNLPVIIHNRDASEDVMAILESWVKTLDEPLKSRPGVMHSFSASAGIAELALNAGFYLGFTGPITFKNADDLRRIAANIPLDRILVETDGPFLTPTPYRGKRNEPAYIPHIAERLAALKTTPIDEFSWQTTQNAIRLFNLPALKTDDQESTL